MTLYICATVKYLWQVRSLCVPIVCVTLFSMFYNLGSDVLQTEYTVSWLDLKVTQVGLKVNFEYDLYSVLINYSAFEQMVRGAKLQ